MMKLVQCPLVIVAASTALVANGFIDEAEEDTLREWLVALARKNKGTRKEEGE